MPKKRPPSLKITATNAAREENLSSLSSPANTPAKTEYLREMSQCAYNIKTIIAIHSTETLGYNKELEHFYILEREKMPKLLSNPIEISAFLFNQAVLREDLLANDYDTSEEIGNIKLAKKEITLLLSKIQRERENIPGYEAKTGLNDCPLKNYIVSLIDDGKKEFPKSLLGVIERTTESLTSEESDTKGRHEEIRGGFIEKIEILKNYNDQGRVKIYVNGIYDNLMDFTRGKSWDLMYQMARDMGVPYDKDSRKFYNYFNFNKFNPLYSKYGGFKITKLLKIVDGYIMPDKEIIMTTQNKITRRLNQLKSAY
ncbi:MAG: hypothetical protein NT077_01215 [Candidatus Taylorbacteria bacterium]|nr:hypothetical protein [Candidatus Taylorbacteria bacterium]